jgi:chromosome segregation and condensation protein ScpB
VVICQRCGYPTDRLMHILGCDEEGTVDDVIATLKSRKKELAVELVRIDKALSALEPERKEPRVPRVITPEHRRAISEGKRRAAAERRAQVQTEG